MDGAGILSQIMSAALLRYDNQFSPMKKIRLGIIGMGNIGKYHADYLLNEKVSRCELVAVCNKSSALLEKFQSLKIYNDGEKLIKSGEDGINSVELANVMVY